MHKRSRFGLAMSLAVVAVLSVSAFPVAASSPEKMQTQFNWYANAAPKPSVTKAKAALKKYRIIEAKGTWICSPAGFGQRSRCYGN